MSPNRAIKCLYWWKPIDARPVGISKTHWEDGVKADIKKLKITKLEDNGPGQDKVERCG
jgi:hypothetical protein